MSSLPSITHSLNMEQTLRADSNFYQALYYFNKAQKALYQKNFVLAQKYIENYRNAMDYNLIPRIDNRKEVKPEISVIIVAYKTNKDLIDCICSVFRSDSNNYEVIIVDNGGNEAVKIALKLLPILYIENPINLLPAEGRNIGAFYARGQILAFLDDDAIADKAYVQSIHKAFMLSDADVYAIRGKVLPKNSNAYQDTNTHYDLGDNLLPKFIDTEGCSAWKTEMYRAAGGMDPLFFGHEGIDLSCRLIKQFNRICTFYWPWLRIYHDYANTKDKKHTKETRHELMREYLVWKNPEIYSISNIICSITK